MHSKHMSLLNFFAHLEVISTPVPAPLGTLSCYETGSSVVAIEFQGKTPQGISILIGG